MRCQWCGGTGEIVGFCHALQGFYLVPCPECTGGISNCCEGEDSNPPKQGRQDATTAPGESEPV